LMFAWTGQKLVTGEFVWDLVKVNIVPLTVG